MQKTVVDERWQKWADDTPKHSARANKVKKLLLDEDGFWGKLTQLRSTFMPVYSLLRKVITKEWFWLPCVLEVTSLHVPLATLKFFCTHDNYV